MSEQESGDKLGFTFKVIPFKPVGPDGLQASVLELKRLDGTSVPFQAYRDEDGVFVIDALPEHGGRPYSEDKPKEEK